MSTYESAYKSLLQGVSQQIPSERLPGQLTAQTNMVSDPVTNIRRRPGLVFKKSWEWEDADDSHVLGWFTDLAGSRVHILLNTNTGNVRILGEDYVEQASLDGAGYLTSSDRSKIRACTVGNEFFLCNVTKVPSVQYDSIGADPANSAFFYVTSGAFGKKYSVEITYSDGKISADYTTPGGTGSSDAALSTPEYIAQKLADTLRKAGTANPVDMTDVRITEWTPLNAYAVQVQRNTGTASSPAWVDITAPADFTVTQLEQQYLRVVYRTIVIPGEPPEAASITFKFQVRANGVWQPTVYSTVMRLAASATLVPATVYASQFTSITTPGDALLYVVQDGPYVFVSRSGGIGISTTVGTAYMIASQGGGVASEGNLPARLPAAANGFICRVGTGDAPKYYRYESATASWLETAKYGSPTGIANVPISIKWDGSAWVLDATPFEGRNSGDDVTNPTHDFMLYGITGISTYQGRLVLMSGPMVSLSASNKPRRFFRSTVTNLINSDPIEIGSGQVSAAAYEWAVPFQKDLVLFSAAYQAVIPSGNALVTPNNATVVPTSGHGVDTTSSPINLGRTLMYCNPRSEDFFGVLEMIPSQYTDSQYVSQDSTPHLPKYMGGRCRFAVSSGVANLAMFAPSGDTTSLVVHEYHWNGDTKDQQAWHTWTFKYPVAAGYFVGDVSVLVFVQNGVVVIGTLDIKAGVSDRNGVRRPFLDFAFPVTYSDNTIELPEWLLTFDPDIAEDLVAVCGTGPMSGSLVGTEVDEDALRTVLSWPSGTAVVGVPYYSGFIPTPPQTTDYQGQVTHTDRATLLREVLGTKNTSDFKTVVWDAYSSADGVPAEVLTFSSPELELGRGLSSDAANVVVPCRTDMRSTNVEICTDGIGELNVTFIEYVAKYHPKFKRR